MNIMHGTNSEPITIGEFITDSDVFLSTENNIGDITDKRGNTKLYKFVVWSNDEGSIPHGHFINTKLSTPIDGCIKLENAEYFPHGAAHDNTYLRSGEPKAFDRFMRQKNKTDSTKTNWEVAVDTWNRNNGRNRKVAKILNIPKYSMLGTDNVYTYYTPEYQNMLLTEYLNQEVFTSNEWRRFVEDLQSFADYAYNAMDPVKHKNIDNTVVHIAQYLIPRDKGSSKQMYFKQEGIDMMFDILKNRYGIDKDMIQKIHLRGSRPTRLSFATPYIVVTR